jgi:hypothetical protein
MKRQTFILTYTKDFRFFTRVFTKGKDNKNEQRNVTFTTEHKVSEKERNRNARKIAAEFSTNDEILYDALLRSPAYGKTFVLKGDPEGKLKREPFNITPLDARKIALKNLFEAAGLEFDSEKASEVLAEEYQIFVNSKKGTNIKGSGPAKIPHKPVDLAKEQAEGVEAAKALYKEKYNEDIPEAFANDIAFLSALSTPNFDAKAYMEKANEPVDVTEEEESIETLREKYFEVKRQNVPNPKKNDAVWIKSKLT